MLLPLAATPHTNMHAKSIAHAIVLLLPLSRQAAIQDLAYRHSFGPSVWYIDKEYDTYYYRDSGDLHFINILALC